MNSKHRSSAKVQRIVTGLLEESGQMSRADIRRKLSVLYGATVVRSAIEYLLLLGKLVESNDGKLALKQLEN